MGNFIDLTGKKFGRLAVIKTHSKEGNVYKILCKCDCGVEKVIRKNKLLSGNTKSCGCLRSETMRKKQTTHGLSRSRFDRIFSGMRSRCFNKNSTGYSFYGGRGIKCMWKTLSDFKKDMYRSYQYHVKKYGELQTSIDRIDNDDGYYKENCRWATKREQSLNQRNNTRYITYNNETLSIRQLSKKYNIPYGCLLMRLNRYNYSIEKALTKSVLKR